MTYDPTSPYVPPVPQPAQPQPAQPDATDTQVTQSLPAQPLPAQPVPAEALPAQPQPVAAPPAPPEGWRPYSYQPAHSEPGPAAQPTATASGTQATSVAGSAFQAPAQVTVKTPWVRLTAVAAAVAVVASLGTAAATGAFATDNSGGATSAAAGDTSDQGQTVQPVQDSTSANPNWEKVAAAVKDAVVAIQVTGTSGEAEGSGVIIDAAKGYVVTNYHVVDAGNKIQVALTDGTVHAATVVGTDPTTDLAVLKLDQVPAGLVAASFGDSSQVQVGQQVMAVGNPLGLDNTVTTGIVSALNRPVTTTSESASSASDAVVTNAIQTDAPINPGNSGGPLFSATGQVIGINSSIASMSSNYSGSSSSGSIGLGFAIPANTVKMITDQLIASGKAEHAYLGVSLVNGTASVDGQQRAGAEVKVVTDGTPAAAGGLKVGDVIVGVGDQVVTSSTSLVAFVRGMAVGSDVTLHVVRDGKVQDIQVTLASQPAASAASGQQGQEQGQQEQGQQQDPEQQGPSQLPQGGMGQLPQELQDLLQQYMQQQQGGGN